MICFRDMTFCAAECNNEDCARHWCPQLQAMAERWWGGPSAPVALSDFSPHCGAYMPKEPPHAE